MGRVIQTTEPVLKLVTRVLPVFPAEEAKAETISRELIQGCPSSTHKFAFF